MPNASSQFLGVITCLTYIVVLPQCCSHIMYVLYVSLCLWWVIRPSLWHDIHPCLWRCRLDRKNSRAWRWERQNQHDTAEWHLASFPIKYEALPHASKCGQMPQNLPSIIEKSMWISFYYWQSRSDVILSSWMIPAAIEVTLSSLNNV
jgi:hypothetical protein